jgi:hypothetical protein
MGVRYVLQHRIHDQSLSTALRIISSSVILLQGTASEATLVALLGAKAKALRRVKQDHPEWSEAIIISKLVGYASSK